MWNEEARTSACWFCCVCFMLVCFAQGGAWLFRRTAERGPCPRRWRTKTPAPPRGSKDERVVVSIWPLKVCYRGLVCHGAKWQRWKKANPEGSLKRFFRLREQRALKVREDIRAFWEGHGVASVPEGPLAVASPFYACCFVELLRSRFMCHGEGVP